MLRIVKKKILVVDDDNELLEALKVILTNEGYEVVASDCKIELPDIIKINPDLLILDVWFGNEPYGVQFAHSIKKNTLLKPLALMLMSSDPKVRVYAHQTNVDSFLEKPFSIDELLERVRTSFDIKNSNK